MHDVVKFFERDYQLINEHVDTNSVTSDTHPYYYDELGYVNNGRRQTVSAVEVQSTVLRLQRRIGQLFNSRLMEPLVDNVVTLHDRMVSMISDVLNQGSRR